MTTTDTDDPGAPLTDAAAAEAVAGGRANRAPDTERRTTADIVRANVLTRFNALLGSMAVLVIAAGHPRDALFGIVIVVNSLIGIIQEVHAARTLEGLRVLTDPTAHVVRTGADGPRTVEVAVTDVVFGDLVELRSGDQVPADATVITTDGIEIDESILTGEADAVRKGPGDPVMSGSVVVAGEATVHVTAVGANAYAHRIAAEAKVSTRVHSELMAAINEVLRVVTWVIVPVGIVLAWSQWNSHDSWNEAVQSTVAGVSAMVPEGLVLLTSITFAAAATTLARRRVLVRELAAVEVLARVDHLCIDKTGTITDGTMTLEDVESIGSAAAPVRRALGALARIGSPNATSAAIAAALPAPDGWTMSSSAPFSSARKWAAATFDGHGTWVLGAPEMVLSAPPPEVAERAAAGRRVLMLACSDVAADELPDMVAGSDVEPVPVAMVVLTETIRPDAPETLAWLHTQGVTVTVLSGDNPFTVAAVAERAGIATGSAMDARALGDDPAQVQAALADHRVLGRISPTSKRAVVTALQADHHVVAMTGDGVNDALALKRADLGIAMGSGAPATRAVADLVLLDGSFAALPRVLAEGRRVIANVERVAGLFLTKTIYAGLLAIAVAVARVPFPLLPRHLTLVGSLTIGIPGFFVALEANERRFVPGMLPRVLRRAVPAGVVSAAATGVAYGLARGPGDASLLEARSVAVVVLCGAGLWVLVRTAGISPAHLALVAAAATALVVVLEVSWLARQFELVALRGQLLVTALGVLTVAIAGLELGWKVARTRPQ